jgi:hypothetical protein
MMRDNTSKLVGTIAIAAKVAALAFFRLNADVPASGEPPLHQAA